MFKAFYKFLTFSDEVSNFALNVLQQNADVFRKSLTFFNISVWFSSLYRVAFKVTAGIVQEREGLVKQLEMLR